MKALKRPSPATHKSVTRQSSLLPHLDFEILDRIVDRAFCMALQMIDLANSREVKDRGEPKVGGHPSACASSKHLLGAIHLVLRNPEDYFACKPHVSPMDHAFNYLLGNFRDNKGWLAPDKQILAMHHLRHFSKEDPVFQSYHAESDPDSFRFFPSGSVGIPPVNALYTALAYHFAKDHGLDSEEEDPMFWCLMGDSEFREGSLAEAMPDAGERQLNRLVWIVDYNRQNLDGTRVLNEKAFGGSDAERIIRIAEANGWKAILLKHGTKRQELFKKPGGEEFRRVLDEELSDFEFQALLAANDPILTHNALEKKSPSLKSWLKKIDKNELHVAFQNLAGHDTRRIVEALQAAKQSPDRPTLIVAYTIKGHGLECQALSGNHSAMPTSEELESIAHSLGINPKTPFKKFEPHSLEEKFLNEKGQKLRTGIEKILSKTQERRERFFQKTQAIEWPQEFGINALKFNPVAHTQWMWGQIAAKLDRLAHSSSTESSAEAPPLDREWKKVAPYFLTMAPDVGSSTNTSPNMNGKIYGDIEQPDFELEYGSKDEKAPDVVPNPTRRTGHIRFEIAEGNCMSAAGSFGKMFHFTGIPFFPAMTIYDFFIKRAHDQLYYNLYWHSHFALIGTPSGVTLAPEGAQHSWKSDFQIPNSVSWEPCFAKELDWILADAFRRYFTGNDKNREGVILRLATKGIAQKEFFDRARRQLRFKMESPEQPSVETCDTYPTVSDDEITQTLREEVLNGAYPLIDYRGYSEYVPGDNGIHLFAMGALVPEAIKASDKLKEDGIYANVFVVTSPELCLGTLGYQTGYSHFKERLGIDSHFYLNGQRAEEIRSKAEWYALQGSRVPIVSVHDGEPGLLDNIGSIIGVKQTALAVRQTSKSGTTWDIYDYHHLNADAIVEAAFELLEDSAGENLRVNRGVLEAVQS